MQLKYYYNQLNYPNVSYNNPNTSKKETISTSGCGICSLAMCLNNLGNKEWIKVDELARFAINCGARDNSGTNLITLLTAICKKHYNYSYYTTNDIQKVIHHIQNNGIVIANQGDKYNVFSTAGHFVVLYDKINSNKILVADPLLYVSKYDSYDRKKRIIEKTSYGCLVSDNEIEKACQDRKPKYYCISYEKTTKTKESFEYKKNKNYTLLTDLKIRSGAGTNHRIKKVEEITPNARQHVITLTPNKNAVLKKGTTISCLNVKKMSNGQIWLQIPSGWICAYQGKKYIG